jgi:hypothetical protein
MVQTNPTAISNSGSSYFTNPKSKIAKLNLDLIINGDERELITNMIVLKNIKSNANTDTNIAKMPDYRDVLAQQRNNSKYFQLFPII